MGFLQPCRLEFGPLAARYPEHTRAVLIGLSPWHASSGYAAERNWDVYVEMTIDPTRPVPLLTTDPRYAGFDVALVGDEVWTGDIPGWKVTGAARGWRFLERADASRVSTGGPPRPRANA